MRLLIIQTHSCIIVKLFKIIYCRKIIIHPLIIKFYESSYTHFRHGKILGQKPIHHFTLLCYCPSQHETVSLAGPMH